MELPALLACLLLQNTWVVDASGGPGANFTDIPPAIAAAADGDILLVQPGTYSHFTLSGKGLRILGSGSSNTDVSGGVPGVPTTISNVPSGSFVYIDRLRFSPIASASGGVLVRVQGPTTQVALAEVAMTSLNLFSTFGGPETLLRVEGAMVWLFDSSLIGVAVSASSFKAIALHALGGAVVHVSGSTLQGSGVLTPGSCAGGLAVSGRAGVRIEGSSTVWVANSSVSGGNGACCLSASFCNCGSGGNAIEVDSSVLRVSGDSTSVVMGGPGGVPQFPCFPPTSGGVPGLGILSVGGSATVHSVTVLAGGAGPATSGPGITLNALPLPVVDVSGTLTTTGTATIALSNGPPDAAFVIAFAAAPGFIPGGPFFLGEILLDLVNWYLLAIGSLSSAGDSALTIPLAGIPPGFVYLPVYVQGLAFDPPGSWRMSNAAVAAIRP